MSQTQARESAELALVRWKKLELLQEVYADFIPFLQDMMLDLGFKTDEIQEDIGDFLENGPQYLMVQAQRGQAKTTITAIFAIWCLIHAPHEVVLIVSAGDRQATEISQLIVQLIRTVDILECLRPDKQAGDRTSVEAFDIHHSLKGVNKSPSVQCMGITANLQGARASLLIADDVESGKNSRTAVQRAQLMHITKDFTSINSTGRIVYLGTPQSIESIYNTLPGRGFTVRVWPGRFPTAEQLPHYHETLAPMLAARLREDSTLGTGHGLNGDQGKPTSPMIMAEVHLVAKELDQGAAYFQLQHLLLTALSDAQRYPLKTENLVVMRLAGDTVPMTVTRSFGQTVAHTINGKVYRTSPALITGQETVGKMSSTVLYLDPAGGGLNADETGWAYGGLLNSNIFIRGVGGVAGGYEPAQLNSIAALVVKYQPTVVKIEKNFGHGAFRAVLTPVVRAACEHAGVPMPGFADDFVTTQKETRIIEVMEPVLGRGALIIDEGVIEMDSVSLQRYDVRLRDTYSFFHQLARITRERNALIHDDRLDAVAGLVAHYAEALSVDQKKAIEAAEKAAHDEMMRNPLNRNLGKPPPRSNSIMARRVRRI